MTRSSALHAVERALGQHRAFVQHGDLHIQRAHELHVVFDHDDGMVLAISFSRTAVCSVSASVMPAAGSSTSSSSGSCASSMPISSHCFWPCDSAPPRSSRRVRARWSPAPRRCGRFLRASRAKNRRPRGRAVAGQRQLQVIEHALAFEDRRLLELAADPEVGDRGLVETGEVDVRRRRGPRRCPAGSCR